MILPPATTPSLDPHGVTLAGYASALGTHPQHARKTYQHLVRHPDSAALPAITRRTDDPDGTTKFCLPLDALSPDGKTLESESVIIPMTSFSGSRWYTLCLSSQIGCRMACSFCETARMGLLRNLTPAEIVRQRLVAKVIRMDGRGLSTETENSATPSSVISPQHSYFADGIQNLVFMGMGEPLDNLDNVLQAIRVFTDPAGLNFPHTQITISTVGRIDGLNKLAALARAEPLFKNLRIAISLNAANDDLRNTLMPINKAMPLAALKETLLTYPLPPKARFLIEYVLIKNMNDSIADANAVLAFCKDLPCIVNLIPYNPQRYAAYETPDEPTILAFLNHLKDNGLFTKRRVTHGRQLMGACGQLGNPEVRRLPASRTPLSVL